MPRRTANQRHTALDGPRASGVYQIRCVPTGKIYVGSTVNMWVRWRQHKSKPNRGTHRNRHLQAAWDKYGEENFIFEVLELVDEVDLLEAEQKWIDSSGCANSAIGFNIFHTAGSPGDAFAQTWEGFIDPTGQEVVINNLQDFCRQNNLNFTIMRNLAYGKRNRGHKGWTHRNSVRQRDYVKTYEGFIDPEGNLVEPITNLAEFCRQRGLDNTHMLAVMRGRICSHRGWTHVQGRKAQPDKTYTGFVNPNGERVIITKLPEFCRQNGLHLVHMYQVEREAQEP